MDVSKKNFAFLFKIEKSKALHFRESAILRKVLVLLGFGKAIDIGEIRF